MVNEREPAAELLDDLYAFTRETTMRAGEVVMGHFLKPHDVSYKAGGRRDPVTEADQASERTLVEAIQDRYPDHAILAEESPDRELQRSEFLWVIDPLDGTTNFLNGLPIFGVSVAVLYYGKPVVGCIFIPYPGRAGGSLFHARVGGGAFQDNEPVAVAPVPQPGSGNIAVLPGRYSRFLTFKGWMQRDHGEVRAMGSICYEATLVTRGVAQYAIFTSPRMWDVAAAVLLVEEAGGLALAGQRGVRDWEPLDRFVYPYTDSAGKSAHVVNWGRPVVVGNAAVASFVAVRVRRRPLLRLRLQRWLRQRTRMRRKSQQG